MATAEVCRRHGISTATFYGWKAKYGGLEVLEAKRPKAPCSVACDKATKNELSLFRNPKCQGRRRRSPIEPTRKMPVLADSARRERDLEHRDYGVTSLDIVDARQPQRRLVRRQNEFLDL